MADEYVMAVQINERDGAGTISVRVQPRASRTEVAGTHGDALKIRLAAPPVDGEANNAELITARLNAMVQLLAMSPDFQAR